MFREEARTDQGMVRIHKNVIASIASIAASEIEGVKRVEIDFKSGFFNMFGRLPRARIKVEIFKNEWIKISIPLVVRYNFNIPEIASKVQENVRSALEKMTDINIKDVEINIRGIEKD
jgi:uncharacterized alkaline shock family protein YloU